MLLDFLELQNAENKALYLELYGGIKKGISDGKIKKNDRLPSIREASSQLKVSRTTIENAYMKLCIEGIAESVPYKGYFIRDVKERQIANNTKIENEFKINYDFSSGSIDENSSDTKNWIKSVRNALCNNDELTSYGDPQGEFSLRQILSEYSYKARGVISEPSNIIIGAGIGPLLNIICGLVGRNTKIGIENGGFMQATTIFEDYGIEIENLKSDKNGATLKDMRLKNINTLFLLPSALEKISIPKLSKRRNDFINWVKEDESRFIIEDDYNGELRYTARTVTSFQGKCPENTIYIGSFSKLLLPSVRIAYMVLPDFLLKKFQQKKNYYNQTCGKVEQLALKNYIENGFLEKHLRKLRKLYYNKSVAFINELSYGINSFEKISIYESSLYAVLKTNLPLKSEIICNFLKIFGIKVKQSENIGEIILSFSGINEKNIKKYTDYLKECLNKCEKYFISSI